MADRARQAASFGAVAGDYDRARPGYPRSAVEPLLPPGASRVLDLGAGTGKLTRALLDIGGLDVVAVEPSAGMRGQFHAQLPQLPILDGTAERIPLPDHSVDAVVVGQAWHWVDPATAVPEVARVLRPGGRLGLIWNTRDESVPWVAELGRMLTVAGSTPMHSGDPAVGPPFGPGALSITRWEMPSSPEHLRALVTTRSYVIVADERTRAEINGSITRLLATDLDGRRTFGLPYITESWSYDLA